MLITRSMCPLLSSELHRAGLLLVALLVGDLAVDALLPEHVRGARGRVEGEPHLLQPARLTLEAVLVRHGPEREQHAALRHAKPVAIRALSSAS
jgi:hypothetical protein